MAATLFPEKEIPELGVGIIYFSGFENILEANPDLIRVVEIEPQTFWYQNRSGLTPFVFDKKKVEYLQQIPQPKIFHGVGFPVGSSVSPDTKHIPCLKEMMAKIKPVWLSEHLSFNNILVGGELCNTNFLLPPLQTPEGIKTAVNSIKNYAGEFNLPFAFETGVNYLSSKSFEINDGYFVNEISIKSDAYILLDLHNVLVNHKNGRQNIYEYIDQLDPYNVLQIHLAGGFYFKDYYLDAHSGVSSNEVLEIFEKTVKKLPNLKAVTFEMLPEYLNFVSDAAVRLQLEKMNRIWELRGTAVKNSPLKSVKFKTQNKKAPSCNEWEQTLGLLAIGKKIEPPTHLSDLLQKDKGLEIIKTLIEKFRGSLVVSSLKLTSRYLMLQLGMDSFNSILRDFWAHSKPKLFASDNGLAFATYLLNHCPWSEENDVLRNLIKYEANSLLTLLDGKEREISLSFNPQIIIESLSKGTLPTQLQRGNYLITIEPESNHAENPGLVVHE